MLAVKSTNVKPFVSFDTHADMHTSGTQQISNCFDKSESVPGYYPHSSTSDAKNLIRTFNLHVKRFICLIQKVLEFPAQTWPLAGLTVTARLLPEPGVHVIQWDVTYDGWSVFVGEIKKLLQQVSQGAGR